MENSTENKNQLQTSATPVINAASQSAQQPQPLTTGAVQQPRQPQSSARQPQQNVVEIDLVSLMIYCLKHWRAVIITMLVCGIFFGGIKGARSLASLQDSDAVKEEMDTYKADKKNYENQQKTLNREIDSLNKKIEQVNTYMTDSALYNMDKNNVYRGTLLYYVDTGYEINPSLTYQTPDRTNSVLRAYASLVESDTFYTTIQKNLGQEVDPKYLRELINVSTDYDSHIITINVLGKTQEMEHSILELIRKNMREEKNIVSSLIVEHEVSLISESEYKTIDKTSDSSMTGNNEAINVADKQQSVENTLNDYQTSLSDYTDQLNQLEEPTEPAIGKKAAVKAGIKYGVVGLILGLVLAGGVLCVQYVLVDRIIDRGRLVSRLPGYRTGFASSAAPVIILGEYFKAPGKNIFDRWAAACDGRKTGEEDLGNVLSVAKANMLNQGAPGRLLIAGMGNSDAVQAFGDTAKDTADSVTVQENILTDPAGIEALQTIDTAVLIADKKKARLSNTLAEVSQLSRLNKRIAGIVLV